MIDIARLFSHGYYVVGPETSVAWFLKVEDAHRECRRLNCQGGTVYTVEPAADPRIVKQA